MGEGNIKEKTDLIDKYSNKTLPKLLIYLGMIPSASKYEKYIKQLKVLFFKWIFYLELRALLIFICLLVADTTISFYHPPWIEKLIAAEGISLLWYLLIDFKNDLIKRGEKNG